MSYINKCSLAVFASGTGSNFINIYNHIVDGRIEGDIKLLISNNPQSKAVEFAKRRSINYKIVNKNIFSENRLESVMLQILKSNDVDIIILAGYMKKIPENIVEAYSGRILNIHPSLLPKFGGKGFYGMKVHEAVIKSGEEKTGITVHLVDNEYDTGNIIYQEEIYVKKNESPISLGERVLKLEHESYPKIIRQFCDNYNKELK